MFQVNKKLLILSTIAVGLVFAETSARLKKDDKGKITTRNLRVIPKNIPHEELISIMQDVSKALGVKCGFCHAEIPGEKTPEGRQAYDFASDIKEEKRIARKMMRMTKEINEELKDINKNFERVDCITCHRGFEHPTAGLDTSKARN